VRAAVDSSIVLDILLDDPEFADASTRLLETYLMAGSVVICPIVFCESAAALLPPRRFLDISKEMGLIYDAFDAEICTLGAQMWRDYRLQKGPRERVVADFLVGAHAQLHAEVLLTRDRGFYRSYFQGLQVVPPHLPGLLT